MDKDTGKPLLIDGKEVIVEKEFIADSANGEVKVEIKVDATTLAGKTIVIFEDLYRNGKHIGVHADIEDVGQTVYLPKIHTTANNKDDENKHILPLESITVRDTVKYENLIKGNIYNVKGELVRKDTGDIITTSEGSFVADETTGELVLDFTFNATQLRGADLVVFETIYKVDKETGENGKTVAEHKDINDKGQTVHIENPTIKTTATFIDGSKIATENDKMTIIDKVEYHNLVIGKEYTIKGIQINKKTGKPFIDADGNVVTGSTTFVAEKTDGIVEVKFTFNGKGLGQTELVTFETLSFGDNDIAEHKDINDKGQTVKIVEKGKIVVTFDNGNKTTDVATGDNTNLYSLLFILFFAVASLIIIKLNMFKKRS